MTHPALLLEARGICRREPDTENLLLRNISLEIHAGRRLAIAGSTGAGKTLLLRALARLDVIDAGQILWRGEDVRGRAIPRFRQQAVYLHQRPALMEGRVEENLRLPYSLRSNRSLEYSRGAVLSLLGRVHRDETFLARSSRDLSGGEAQIVALVRAIQLEPALLLLDEPTAALDQELTRLIEELVAGWFDQSPGERAFVWVSHDREQVARVADHVVNMKAGCLLSASDQKQESGT